MNTSVEEQIYFIDNLPKSYQNRFIGLEKTQIDGKNVFKVKKFTGKLTGKSPWHIPRDQADMYQDIMEYYVQNWKNELPSKTVKELILKTVGDKRTSLRKNETESDEYTALVRRFSDLIEKVYHPKQPHGDIDNLIGYFEKAEEIESTIDSKTDIQEVREKIKEDTNVILDELLGKVTSDLEYNKVQGYDKDFDATKFAIDTDDSMIRGYEEGQGNEEEEDDEDNKDFLNPEVDEYGEVIPPEILQADQPNPIIQQVAAGIAGTNQQGTPPEDPEILEEKKSSQGSRLVGPEFMPSKIEDVERHHPISLLLFFGTINSLIDWDNELKRNITSLNIPKTEIVQMMDSIVKTYGDKIYVFERKTDKLTELNELVQLQFCLERNLNRGDRYKSANVKLSDLTNLAISSKQSQENPRFFPAESLAKFQSLKKSRDEEKVRRTLAYGDQFNDIKHKVGTKWSKVNYIQ